ncbi:MAG TPA: Rieske (2Fe-2S) protein, partial [Nitrospira sp.]|nr:Rieske (2Fe-2S) protein [Nitrospira sp.]
MIQPPSPEVVSSRSAPLFGFWYPAVPSHTLGPGMMKGVLMLGLPIVLCRDREGRLAAMRDLCPHRGMPLSC